MSIATKIGTLIGTSTAYTVHYMEKGSSPVVLVSIAYANKDKICKFAAEHSLIDKSDEGISNNLLECLQYID